MKIIFYNHELCYRGTTKAVLAYIQSLREFDLDLDIIYAFNAFSTHNDVRIGTNFLKYNVTLIPLHSLEQLLHLSNTADWLYYVSSAKPDDYAWIKNCRCKTFLHQVGYQEPDYDSSSQFAYTSHWQSNYFTGAQAPVLPYIISPPEHPISKKEARSCLGIHDEHIVIGRHGGRDTWNLPFASKAVYDCALQNQDKVFLFLGTDPFCNLPNVRFLPSTSDQHQLEIFLSACDLMLHARWEGETFGLACAEFLVRQKPIITWAHSRERNHILLAEQSIMFYHHYGDLYSLLCNLTKESIEILHSLLPTSKLLLNYSKQSIGSRLKNFILC